MLILTWQSWLAAPRESVIPIPTVLPATIIETCVRQTTGVEIHLPKPTPSRVIVEIANQRHETSLKLLSERRLIFDGSGTR